MVPTILITMHCGCRTFSTSYAAAANRGLRPSIHGSDAAALNLRLKPAPQSSVSGSTLRPLGKRQSRLKPSGPRLHAFGGSLKPIQSSLSCYANINSRITGTAPSMVRKARVRRDMLIFSAVRISVYSQCHALDRSLVCSQNSSQSSSRTVESC